MSKERLLRRTERLEREQRFIKKKKERQEKKMQKTTSLGANASSMLVEGQKQLQMCKCD